MRFISEVNETGKMYFELPIYGVSGVSGTGKTTLVCDLMEELTERGYNISTIKHTRGEFSIDEKGKDTWEHREAGADLVVFSTDQETDLIFNDTLKLDEIISMIKNFGDYDAVLIEGMKDADIPKIDLRETENNRFDIKSISDDIEKRIEIYEILELLPKDDCKRCGYENCYELASAVRDGKRSLEFCELLNEGKRYVELLVNGEKISLGNFPTNFIKRTTKGMVSSLKGVDEREDISEIELKISDHDEERL